MCGRSAAALNEAGAYDTLSDMRQLGYMLLCLSEDQDWEDSCASFCAALLRKQLDAEAALRHEYLHDI